MGAPPLAASFVVEHLAGFDDEALRTFLRPGSAGVDPTRLGTALRGGADACLALRILDALAEPARRSAWRGLATEAPATAVASARRHVVDRLFWPLLYWHDPGAYEELVGGEHIAGGLLDALRIDGRDVADLGAGAGRFSLEAARRARRVIAVDAVPPLLDRLRRHAAEAGLDNVEVRRGAFDALPLDDAAVDVAVACSSLTSRAPWGGEAAVAEALRVVRPGGEVVVIWPDDPAWFCARGFRYLSVPQGESRLRFADVATAERLCAAFYGARAAAWVTSHQEASVPFTVLGVPPPVDACVYQVGERPAQRPYDDSHPRPGVDLPG